MTFVYDEIPESEMHLYAGQHFWNYRNRPLGLRWRAIDRGRDMFIVQPGSEGGPVRTPDVNIFFMQGYHIKFLSDFVTQKLPEGNQDVLLIQRLLIPANLLSRISEIRDLVEEGLRVFYAHGRDEWTLIMPIVFDEIVLVPPVWIIDREKGIDVAAVGPALKTPIQTETDMQARREDWRLFAEGRRETDETYNFRIHYFRLKDSFIDLQAVYRLNDKNEIIWEVKRARTSKDFAEQGEELAGLIPDAMAGFSNQADARPVSCIVVDNTEVSTSGPGPREILGSGYAFNF